VYELRPAPPDRFEEEVERLVRAGYVGWNVTVPHKERMARLVDEIDPDAAAAESVNTVVNAGGRLRGWSTDGYGLEAAVREAFGLEPDGLRVVMLGAGGAARAATVYLARRGVSALTVANRTLSRAEALAGKAGRIAPRCKVRALPLDPDAPLLAAALEAADLVIQATSLGLKPADPPPLPAELLPPGIAVLDMIYHPSRFMEEARRRGCRVADGRGMLLHQGARSFEIWTGRAAPVEVMREALYRALEHRRNNA